MDGPDDESIYSLNLLLTPSVDPPSNRIQLDIFSLYPVLGSLEPGQLCEQLAVALKTTNRPVHLKTGERVTLAISSALFVTCWSTPRHFQTNGCEFGIFTFRIFEGEWKVWTVLRFYKLAQVGKSGGLIRPQNFLAHTHSFWQNLDNLYYEPCSLHRNQARCVWGQNWLFSILGESSLWCVEKRNIIWALLGSKSKFWDHTVLSAAEATTFNSEKFLKSGV